MINPLEPIPSAACDAVLAAEHPSPEEGGPCATCAFRVGTEPNKSEHTVALARLCVEGFRMFHCHEKPGLCRGYVAAANLRGLPGTEEEIRRAAVYGCAADLLNDGIDHVVATYGENEIGGKV